MLRVLTIATCVVFGASLLAGIGRPTPVEAHVGATGIVKERMDLMKGLGDALKGLARVFKGEEVYDAARVAAAARRIEEGSGDHMLRLFPAGSTAHPSEARDAIWRDWAEFETAAEDLGDRAAALSPVAGDGPEQARAAFAAVAESCKACHQDFKAD